MDKHLLNLLRIRILDWSKDPDPKHWKTIRGSHVHLDKNGNYDGGAGNKFNGRHHYGPDWKAKSSLMQRLTNALNKGAHQKPQPPKTPEVPPKLKKRDAAGSFRRAEEALFRNNFDASSVMFNVPGIKKALELYTMQRRVDKNGELDKTKRAKKNMDFFTTILKMKTGLQPSEPVQNAEDVKDIANVLMEAPEDYAIWPAKDKKKLQKALKGLNGLNDDVVTATFKNYPIIEMATMAETHSMWDRGDKETFRSWNARYLSKTIEGLIDQAKMAQNEKNALAKTGGVDKPIINENPGFNPKAIAGVQRGKPMEREKADQGRANPNFDSVSASSEGFHTNCQTCVVAYELRLRGYDLSALGNKNNQWIEELSHYTNRAWLNENDMHPAYIYPGANVSTAKRMTSWLKDNLEQGARYTVQFGWKGRKHSGHIVHIRKTPGGELELFDPQCGMIKAYGDSEITNYFSEVRFQSRGWPTPPKVLRVDNLKPDVDFLQHCLKGSEQR